MKHQFLELIDAARIQGLTDLFYAATGMPAAIVDLDGTTVTNSGWEDLCANFHRANPETIKRCSESDAAIADRIAAGQNRVVCRCKNGLIHAAVPLAIEGEHAANLFTGQFLLEEPDKEYFRQQAKHFGFDETSYMEAVERIPVVNEARVHAFLDYFSELAEMIGEMGLKRLKQIEAEAALHESEERWAAMLSSIGDAVIATDCAGTITFMNPVAEALTGWRLADASRTQVAKVFSIISERTRTVVENPIDRVLKEGTTVGLANHTILMRKDGSEIFIDDSGAPIRDRDGAIKGVVLVFRDISDRRQSEKDLFESRMKLAEAMDLSRIVYWELDPRTDEFIFDDAFYAFCGATAQREGGYRMSREEYGKRFIHPKDLRLFTDLTAKRLASTGREFHENVEHRIVRRDGEVRHILARIHMTRDDEGRILQCYGANQDITERKQAEEELREKEANFRKIFEENPIGMAMTGADYRFLRVNPAFCRMIRYTEEELTALTFKDITHPGHLEEDAVHVLDLFDGKISLYRTEKRYLRKDGQVVWGACTVRAVRDKNGAFLYFLTTDRGHHRSQAGGGGAHQAVPGR